MPIPELELEALEKSVLDKCDSFAHLGVWSNTNDLNYRGWLSNFSDDTDKLYALHLLNSFTFYNKELCSALFFGCVQDLSISSNDHASEIQANDEWKQKLAHTVFIPVEGEYPNITDSANVLASVLRKSLGIQQSQIKRFDEFLSAVLNGTETATQVVFFDDLIGSGQQFLTMLNTLRFGRRPIDAIRSRSLNVSYVCFVATEFGTSNIKNGILERGLPGVPDVGVKHGHLLSGRPRVLDSRSKIWPASLHSGVEEFLDRSWTSAGSHADGAYGFRDLGLTLAFEHSMPDATLPIFYVKNDNWCPLMERR